MKKFTARLIALLLAVTAIFAVTACGDGNGDRVERVTLNTTMLSLNVDESEQLVATVLPKGINAKVTWESSNETVATVDEDGTVRAHAVGNATVWATAGGISSNACAVTVYPTRVTETVWESLISEVVTTDRITIDMTLDNSDGTMTANVKIDNYNNYTVYEQITDVDGDTAEYYYTKESESSYVKYTNRGVYWEIEPTDSEEYNSIISDWDFVDGAKLPFEILQTVDYDDFTYSEGVYQASIEYGEDSDAVNVEFEVEVSSTPSHIYYVKCIYGTGADATIITYNISDIRATSAYFNQRIIPVLSDMTQIDKDTYKGLTIITVPAGVTYSAFAVTGTAQGDRMIGIINFDGSSLAPTTALSTDDVRVSIYDTPVTLTQPNPTQLPGLLAADFNDFDDAHPLELKNNTSAEKTFAVVVFDETLTTPMLNLLLEISAAA